MDPGRWIAITRLRAKRYADLISTIHLGSGGQGVSRTRGGGANRRRRLPAAALLWELAGLRRFSVPGLKSIGLWVYDGLRDTRSPPGAFAGLGEVSGGTCCDGGGSVRRTSPASGVLRAPGATDHKIKCQKDREELRVLTGVWIKEGGRCGVLASRSSGRIRAVQGRSSWGSRGRVSPSFWAPRFGSRSTCEGDKEVRAVRGAPTVWNRHGGATHRRRSRVKFRRSRERKTGRIGLGDSSAALQIFCATRGRLWCGGGVRARRRRGLGAAEQSGAVR